MIIETCAVLVAMCNPVPVDYVAAVRNAEPVRYCIAAINHEGVKIVINDNLDRATFLINIDWLLAHGQHITEVTCDE